MAHDFYRKVQQTEFLAAKKITPAVFEAYVNFDKAAMADGALPRKTKELIAVAVAHTTQCPACIDIHTKGAKKAGASEQEVMEAAWVAAALRAGAAVTHSGLSLSSYEES
ncbi:MAG TPA: carboxymuconolactone decarboxylase family protein [Acidobacteriota bacterium]|nr:carboxymuconolactone decarboxylase family protein [Acidobacteriota bacterium]